MMEGPTRQALERRLAGGRVGGVGEPMEKEENMQEGGQQETVG